MSDVSGLLRELTPEVGRLLERHLSNAKEWFPHELVPWQLGPEVKPDQPWSEEVDGAQLDAATRASLWVNLLTEDNLPFYTRALSHTFGIDEAWGEWAQRWTAEEGRHSIVMRDYMVLTRLVDPVGLERARMHQVSTGQVPSPPTAAHALVYLSLQELATRLAHHNTAKRLTDEWGWNVMKRVVADENLHHLFYRDLAAAAFELAPSTMVVAAEQVVREFQMPGTGIEGFERMAREIAKAGIYDFGVHHDQILQPVLFRHWGIDQLSGLDDEAERARDALVNQVERIGKAAARAQKRRERQLETADA